MQFARKNSRRLSEYFLTEYCQILRVCLCVITTGGDVGEVMFLAECIFKCTGMELWYDAFITKVSSLAQKLDFGKINMVTKELVELITGYELNTDTSRLSKIFPQAAARFNNRMRSPYSSFEHGLLFLLCCICCCLLSLLCLYFSRFGCGGNGAIMFGNIVIECTLEPFRVLRSISAKYIYVVHQQDHLLLGQLRPTFPPVWTE